MNWDDLEFFTGHKGRGGNYMALYFAKKNYTFKVSRDMALIEKIYTKENDVYVKVCYSKIKNSMAFKFVDNPECGALKVSKVGSFSANGIFQESKIFMENMKGRYPAKKENIADKGEFWIICFDEKF